MRPPAALFPLAVTFAAVAGVALAALSGAPPAPPPPAPEPAVRLAVLVVFDQLRADFLERWQPLFGPDGFVRLQRDGAWFTDCHYPYATTTTGPGHASMLTGACPDAHGIVDNSWIEGGETVYCAGAPGYTAVPPPPDLPPDPDDKRPPLGRPKPAARPESGGTPERLLSETVADVLKRETNGRAKVFGVSLKDRSAILPTGRRPDGAFWFYGVFGTSSYYALPAWVKRFNASRAADRWFGTDWTRLGPESSYAAAVGPDARDGEGKGVNQGVAFPHPMAGTRRPAGLTAKYYEALANSPFGNDLLLGFAKACVVEERLGLRGVPDLLVVSFSSNDLIGHTWGPDSHEAMDATLRSDAVVAELLAFLDARIGKGRYAVGLTADHGVCPLPEVTRERGRRLGRADWQAARRVDPKQLGKALDAHLSAAFPAGRPAGWAEVSYPWFYLRPEAVRAAGVPRERVAAEAARFLAGQPHVARAFTREQLTGPAPAGDDIAARMRRSYHPSRCGDVGVVLAPYCIPYPTISTGTTHGGPYDYDTHVPLLLYGPGVRGGARDEPTTPLALASVFAKWLNVSRPKDAAYPVPATLE